MRAACCRRFHERDLPPAPRRGLERWRAVYRQRCRIHLEVDWKPGQCRGVRQHLRQCHRVEVVDDLTVTLTFVEPTLAWYVPFTGGNGGQVYPGHSGASMRTIPRRSTASAPIRSAPAPTRWRCSRERPDHLRDQRALSASRTSPIFPTVNLKGGGDAASAAVAVLQTGDMTTAGIFRSSREILADLVAEGKGVINARPGIGTEIDLYQLRRSSTSRLTASGRKGTRPTRRFPIPTVRQALNMAIDRDTIATQLYGDGGASRRPIPCRHPGVRFAAPALHL